MADPALVDVEAWQEFYTSLGHTDPADRGLLPFRVWQFFDEMVDAVAAGDAARFVCAAGLVSHYVGDASQPLHGSYLADGIPATPTTPAAGPGRALRLRDRDGRRLLRSRSWPGCRRRSPIGEPSRGRSCSGHDAAVAVVRLMDRTAKTLKPTDLIAVFAQTQVGKTTQGPTVTQAVLATLWDHVGTATVKVMADGTRTLAAIWEAAFAAGQGDEHHPHGEHQGRRPGRAAGALPGPRLRAVARPRPHRRGPEPQPRRAVARPGRSGPAVLGGVPAQLHAGLHAGDRSWRWRSRRCTVRSERSSWVATAWSVSPASSSAEDLPVEGGQALRSRRRPAGATPSRLASVSG